MMITKKLDYKILQKELYLPGSQPSVLQVPRMTFLMADGRGDPNTPDGGYSQAVALLYALAYAIKMNNKKQTERTGNADYVIPPLEGFWQYDDGGPFRFGDKTHFVWTALIRQPEFVTEEVFEQAARAVARKKPGIDINRVSLNELEEGLCVHCMHTGPYDTEPATVEKMNVFMQGSGLAPDFSQTRRHHEIYLGDPRKTEPLKLKTIIRHPVKRMMA